MGKCISKISVSQPESQAQKGFVLPTNDYNCNYNGDSPTPKTKIRIRGLYDFDGRDSEELSFKEGDLMEFVEEVDSLWWIAVHLESRMQGFVPQNYVVVDDGRPNSHPAWFKIRRLEANRLLLMMGNPKGTFIIRPSSDERSFALSIRYFDVPTDEWSVKHYKIRMTDCGQYFLSRHRVWDTVDELIKYYANNPTNLCCYLTKPCPKQERPSVQFRDIELNKNSLRLVREIGAGSFGQVWLAVWSKALEVAVKTLKTGTMNQQQFIEEAEIMHKMQHPRIVQILGVCTKEEPMYIVTEYMKHGSLLDYLRKDKGETLNMNNVIDFMSQVAEGMAYLESLHFIHRDLRAANILVGENKEAKVANFGLARITEDSVYSGGENTKYPIKWTAPEAMIRKVFSVKTDVWSFGVLMFEIVSFGNQPYIDMDNRTVMREVQNGYRMPDPSRVFRKSCTRELYEIMLQCWDANPEARPTFHYLRDLFDDWQIHTKIQCQDYYI